jgi:hypothetical protein
LTALRILSSGLWFLAVLCLAGAAPAHEFPAPDPPRVVRPDDGRRPAPDPGAEDVPGPPRAATLEWLGHRTPDGQHPNGAEQQVVWLMNRARQNPAAEGIFLATATEPDIAGGRSFFRVNLGLLQGEFAALLPKPPAAFDVRLYNAALAHSLDLIARDAQDHVGQFDRIDAAGFQFTEARVSVFSFADSALNAHAALNIDWGPGDGTGMQPGRGHRQAIMAIDGDYTNIGLAAVPEGNPVTRVGDLVVSINYCAARAGAANHFNRFVVGTVWRDDNGNGRYDPGEGLGGVTVTPDRGTFFAVTAAGGGYAIPITAPGDYNLTFSGGSIGPGATQRVSVGGTSVLLDHVVGATSVASRTAVTTPADGTVVPLGPGATVTVGWMPLDGIGLYGLEFTGPGLAFTNPNGAGADPVNGLGGQGGALSVSGTSVTVALDAAVSPGAYQVRVIGLSPAGPPIGTFSDAVTLHLGVDPAARPAITAPVAGATLPRGGPVTITWTALDSVTRYAIEVVGPGGAFAVPNAAAFDPAATRILVTGTSLAATVPVSMASGSYQIRVLGLTATGLPLARASDAVTLVVPRPRQTDRVDAVRARRTPLSPNRKFRDVREASLLSHSLSLPGRGLG